MRNKTEIEEFWQRFSEENDLNSDFTVHRFGADGIFTEHLIRMVLDGQKKASTESLFSYQVNNRPLPKNGSYAALVDYNYHPVCILRIKEVIVIPFKEMTYDLCKEEGDNPDLETWREKHIPFFTEEGTKIGYTFDENIIIVFKKFEMIYKTNQKEIGQ